MYAAAPAPKVSTQSAWRHALGAAGLATGKNTQTRAQGEALVGLGCANAVACASESLGEEERER